MNTLENFYLELENTKLNNPHIIWQFYGPDNDQIRGFVYANEKDRIPALVFCPITAVCWNKTGKFYTTCEVGCAAFEMDFVGVAQDIIEATDNEKQHNVEIGKALLEILEL